MEEIFKTIPWFSWYMAGSNGNIKRLWYNVYYKWKYFRYYREEKLLKWAWNRYRHVKLNWKFLLVHRIIASAFLWLNLYDKTKYVCHKDDNPNNNKVENLFIWTAKENSQDMVNKWRNIWNRKLTFQQVKEIIEMKWKKKQIELSKEFNVSRSCIAMIHCWKNFSSLLIKNVN